MNKNLHPFSLWFCVMRFPTVRTFGTVKMRRLNDSYLNAKVENNFVIIGKLQTLITPPRKQLCINML